ncbi:MAG: hypothetical protein RSB41_01425 [Bacilli bacterium]
MDYLGKALLKLCLFFDDIIYGILGGAYSLFQNIVKMNTSALELLSINFENIVSRLTLLIGVFMIFKLAFTFISYMANPDQLTDAKTGASSIIMSVVVSIALLVSMPFIFQQLDNLQNAIFSSTPDPTDPNRSSSFIDRLIFGQSAISNGNGGVMGEDAALGFKGTLFTSFVSCSDSGNSKDGQPECVTAIENVKSGASFNTLGEFVDNGQLRYHYPILSAAVALFAMIVLFSFSIEIGIRLFKLLFMQIVYPIPVLSYMTPKGKEGLIKYGKMYLDIYLEVFVKTLILYMAIFLINTLMQNIDGLLALANIQGGAFAGALVKIVLIISIFYFAQGASKLISDLFGINVGDGKLKGMGFLGGALGLGAGVAGAAILGGKSLVGNTATAYKNAGPGGLNKAKAIAASLGTGAVGLGAGVIGAGFGGATSGFKSTNGAGLAGIVGGTIGAVKGGVGAGKAGGTRAQNISTGYTANKQQQQSDAIGYADRMRQIATSKAGVGEKDQYVASDASYGSAYAKYNDALKNTSQDTIDKVAKAEATMSRNENYIPYKEEFERASSSGDAARISAAQANYDNIKNSMNPDDITTIDNYMSDLSTNAEVGEYVSSRENVQTAKANAEAKYESTVDATMHSLMHEASVEGNAFRETATNYRKSSDKALGGITRAGNKSVSEGDIDTSKFRTEVKSMKKVTQANENKAKIVNK